jgi:hypothetical protein
LGQFAIALNRGLAYDHADLLVIGPPPFKWLAKSLLKLFPFFNELVKKPLVFVAVGPIENEFYSHFWPQEAEIYGTSSYPDGR